MVRLLTAIVGLLALTLIVLVAGGAFGPTAPTRTPVPIAVAPARATPEAARTSQLITLTLTEQQLTAAAQSYTPLTISGITVTDPTVRFDAGHATLVATGHALFLSGPIVVVATPVVTDGSAGTRVDSATFAGLGLPDSTKQDIADTFTRTLRANIPAGVRVTAISVRIGTIVVEAVPA